MAGQLKGVDPTWTKETEGGDLRDCFETVRALPATSVGTRGVAVDRSY